MGKRTSTAGPVTTRAGRRAAVRRARHAQGHTLEDVASRVPSMDPKYLGEIERGWHVPTLSTAKRIADALEITLAELVRDL